MKIKFKPPFRYAVSASVTHALMPGVYDVPGDVSAELAAKAIRYGKAERLEFKKVAPENKLAEVPETKAAVGGKTVRRRRARTKPDA